MTSTAIAAATFQTWKNEGEEMLAGTERLQWAIGDWWNDGVEVYGRDYLDGLKVIAATHGTINQYARVARAFPQPEPDTRRSYAHSPHRIEALSWTHHQVCAAITDENDRMAWLEDALRQGWSYRQLHEEIRASITGTRTDRPPSLSIRAIGDLYDLTTRAAARAGMEPAAWAAGVLEQAARKTLALEAA